MSYVRVLYFYCYCVSKQNQQSYKQTIPKIPAPKETVGLEFQRLGAPDSQAAARPSLIGKVKVNK